MEDWPRKGGKMICPICNTNSPVSFHKPSYTVYKYSMQQIISGICYSVCPNCGCCFTLDEFTPETHNQGSEERNEDGVNLERLRRIRTFHEGYSVIDFGCGNGQFTRLAREKGYTITPIDRDTEIKLDDIPSNSIHVINCVEVIEHIIQPKEVIEEFHRVLKSGGIVYLESSFTDFLGNPEKAGYIDPNIGHVLVHSRKSIEMLFGKFEAKWLNQNVVVFKKI